MLAQSNISLIAFFRQLLQQRFLIRLERQLLRREEIVGNTRMDQLLDIVLRSIDGPEIGTHRLPLDRQLDLLIRNIPPHRSIELVRLATTPCRRTATSIEEHRIDTIL